MVRLIYIILGGATGTVSRYLFSGIIYRLFGTGFAYGTLAVNLMGCFVMGFFAAVAEKKFFLNTNMRLLLMIGFCGAFTTFSTFVFETDSLFRNGEMLKALANIGLTVAGVFVFFRIGSLLGEVL